MSLANHISEREHQAYIWGELNALEFQYRWYRDEGHPFITDVKQYVNTQLIDRLNELPREHLERVAIGVVVGANDINVMLSVAEDNRQIAGILFNFQYNENDENPFRVEFLAKEKTESHLSMRDETTAEEIMVKFMNMLNGHMETA